MTTSGKRLFYFGLCFGISLIIFLQTPLWAGEYFYSYHFDIPDIIKLPNGLHVVQFDDTWQKNGTPGTPVLPALTSKIFIPADEEVISVTVDYGQAVPVKGVYPIQFAIGSFLLHIAGWK